MGCNKLVLRAGLLLLIAQAAWAFVNVEIGLQKYTHDCDEDFWPVDSYCDPMFTLCVDRPTNKIIFNRNTCEYQYLSRSSHFQNWANINFETAKNKRGLRVPWIFKLSKLTERTIMFAVYVEDDDTTGDDDHMVTLSKNISVIISPTQDQAQYRYYSMRSGGHIFTFKARMYCVPHYFGENCQVNCIARNDAKGHYTCEEGTGKKLCLKGWTGDNCEKDIDECSQRYCKFGTCENLPGDYNCHCSDYFTGRNCSIMSNPCGSNPCQQEGSFCVGDPITFDYECHCLTGWEGKNCQIKMDPCLYEPCIHEGICESTENNHNYKCDCPKEWEGKDCEEKVDPCIFGQCENDGQCISTETEFNYTCQCQPGWLGKHCEIRFEPCVNSSCKNDARCDEDLMTHSYHCTCAKGWEGTHCEIKSDPCLEQPCDNGGTCESSEDKFSHICFCPYDWEGDNCKIRRDPCESFPCLNGATCDGDRVDYSYKCLCEQGWEGDNCEVPSDPCDSSPCLHNGICFGNREKATFNCTCSQGWRGEWCEEWYQPCMSAPCQNGGFCMKDIISYTYNCTCIDGWEGDHCEERGDPCLKNQCRNNGSCEPLYEDNDYYCQCPYNYYGEYCQHLDPGSDSNSFSSKQSSAVGWQIPVAAIGAVLVLILVIVFLVFFRRRRKESKAQYVDNTLAPVVVYQVDQANGIPNLAFENDAYSRANTANRVIEAGRANRENVALPTTPTEDDLFNPVKPSFSVNDEELGAVGGQCRNENKRTKRSVSKDSDDDFDNTDRKCARVSTLARRAENQRADENPYQDFKSLSMKTPNKVEPSDENGDDDEEDEDHYQNLDDVIEAIQNRQVEGPSDEPPALPPFNVGVQDNPLLHFSMSDSDSLSSDVSAGYEEPVSHYQEPEENGTSPDDIYTDVIRNRHEQDTLPRRPRSSNTSNPNGHYDNADESDGHPESTHYDIPTGNGPRTDSLLAAGNIYDNPRLSVETTYDVPRTSPSSAGNDFTDLFSNKDPWTPDPFQESSSNVNNSNPPTLSTAHIYANSDSECSDENENENESQEDIKKLRLEVIDFMQQCEPKEESKEYSSFA